ncbi:DUF5996 family protein [Microbulbifer sp. THAF38]|uniref:DUF5996 family protein n=1 Tax=Microbulbifer sp. THAF38 TaxID=2587856 RepID=UPI001268A796|nr:DUF5996 family protein [Microbulbifer sp. THAF38]QFT56727.1 hypothetical protein FIU95_19435 [Microbulbifer sp. THAF38]
MKAPFNRSKNTDWPELHFQDWSDTAATLHLWTQVIGKIRLVQSPWTNHSWHVPFYVTARGLNSSLIPYGGRAFSVEFDLLDHQLSILVSDGGKQKIPLRPMCVADFYMKIMSTMKDLGLSVDIYTTPSEIANGTPFEEDVEHCQYDSKFVTRFWQALVQIDRIFKDFRARFIGKCSPVHFFWGSFDLAVTRFSGREAPLHPGGVPNFPDWVAQEAYSHEVSSAGFWPGGGGFEDAAFYSYTYPASEKFADKKVKPDAAFYSKELAEFILPYDEVRRSTSPDETLMTFLQSTYEAAASTGKWDRSALEKNF